jgi:hypothetical protein
MNFSEDIDIAQTVSGPFSKECSLLTRSQYQAGATEDNTVHGDGSITERSADLI